MRTFKIKDQNCYITLDDEAIEDFNIDSDYTRHVADYEEVAKYFLAQSELLGHLEPFEIEEVTPMNHESCVIFSITA